MTPWRYILRSLAHHRVSLAGVFAGAVLGATVLLGALFAGDSIGESLRQIAQARTGRASHVVTAGDRFFREELAREFSDATGAQAAPLLLARGTASASGGAASTGQVQLVGVTDAFWQLAPQPGAVSLDATAPTIAVNDTLARRLRIKVGDTVVLRLQKPGILASDAPIAGADARLQTLRCTVATVLGGDRFGRFTLESTQLPPASVFLPLATLQQALRQPGRANVLLVGAQGAATALQAALAQVVQLADYGLALRWLELPRVFELTSTRIFIDPGIAQAVTRALPDPQPVTSYLVNELAVGERAAPYSIATATTHAAAPFLPADLRAGEVVVNDWLADDLQARVGDELRLKFYRAGTQGALVEQTSSLRIRAVVPLDGIAADRSWMPEFPGISEAKRQGDWDSGLPLDLDRIRDKDEKYWDKFRGAPKAYVALETARELWSTRWGSYTALRIPFERARESELAQQLRQALRPEMNQLIVRDFGAAATESARSTVDFAGLFVGMSFFLIAASLALVAMLFQFALLQRNREDALLGAVGVPPRRLLRWRLAEAATLLGLGSVAGLALATLYTRGILRFLGSIWAGQGGGGFAFAASPRSIGIGVGTFVALSLLVIWFAIRRQARRALSIRLAARTEELEPPRSVRRTSGIIAVAGAAVAGGAVAVSGRPLAPQLAFYLAGFALLGTGLALCRRWLAARDAGEAATAPTPGELGRLNLRARRSRSLTVVGLIAAAVFMVLSVASFRKQIGDDWLERRSGTGGFALWVETASPLNAAREAGVTGFEPFAPHAAEIATVVPLRTGAGDNANCFNLNTVAQPRLLAVDTARLAAREAFSPRLSSNTEPRAAWDSLRALTGSGAVPALVDATTLQWALKRQVGDVIAYTDENGRRFDVAIAGTIADSIFQGYLVVDEALFLQKYPSNPGYSIFLVDARDPARAEELRRRLETATRDLGGRVDLTRDVLAAFHGIENTYIAIFNVLGSLGVILGSLGLAVVVARNLHERRGEFAVMAAMGIPRGVLARVVFAEFGRLVLWGAAIGVIASALAVGPNLRGLPPAATLLLVGGLLAGIVILNLVGGWAVFRWALRDLRPSLQQATG